MNVLSLQDVVKSFRAPGGGGSPTIVDVPQLDLAAGQHMALSGSSGSGKTTLLNLIAGILAPDRGTISVAGHTMSEASESVRDRIRGRHIGYIFQTFNLLQGYSALENVELGMWLGRGRDRERAIGLLNQVGLGDRLHHRPRELSVGQQQRVAVARALANRPDLVLADEPTGNLDPRHAQAALELIREVCRECGAALLLVSHDRDVLGAFDQVKSLTEINRTAAGAAA